MQLELLLLLWRQAKIGCIESSNAVKGEKDTFVITRLLEQLPGTGIFGKPRPKSSIPHPAHPTRQKIYRYRLRTRYRYRYHACAVGRFFYIGTRRACFILHIYKIIHSISRETPIEPAS